MIIAHALPNDCDSVTDLKIHSEEKSIKPVGLSKRHIKQRGENLLLLGLGELGQLGNAQELGL